jgi:hypothetical protein
MGITNITRWSNPMHNHRLNLDHLASLECVSRRSIRSQPEHHYRLCSDPCNRLETALCITTSAPSSSQTLSSLLDMDNSGRNIHKLYKDGSLRESTTVLDYSRTRDWAQKISELNLYSYRIRKFCSWRRLCSVHFLFVYIVVNWQIYCCNSLEYSHFG